LLGGPETATEPAAVAAGPEMAEWPAPGDMACSLEERSRKYAAAPTNYRRRFCLMLE